MGPGMSKVNGMDSVSVSADLSSKAEDRTDITLNS